jgi:predicted membrane-bound spermidine synthase
MVRRIALWITFATGFSGLVYEVTWQKYLATLLGSHSEATAAVIGLFLGGLAVGYALFGGVTRRRLVRTRPRLLAVYGGIEAAIGLYALAFPWLFELAHAASPHLPGSQGPLGFALDVVLSALLIGPPAVLMGATIPFLTQALAHDLEDATRIHALVYASNTAGAFAGALAAGFWLVPLLGLVGVLVAMGLVNLTAGAALVVLDPRARAEGLGIPAPADPASTAARPAGFAAYLALALLVGFAMATLQTAFIRLGALAFGASQFTFSMVVAVFVLCIALGSFAVSALSRIPSSVLVGSLWALVALLALLYPALGDAPYWGHVLRTLFAGDPSEFYPYHLAAFALVLVAIGPPVVLSGATLPLVFHQLRREVGELGALAGRLYSANTIGSLAGALVGGYALLFWLDIHSVYRLAVAALAVAAALATRRALRVRPLVPAAALAASLALLALLPAWSQDRLSAGLFRFRKALPETYRGPDALFAARQLAEVVFYDDDPTASIAVREQRLPDGALNRSISTNGKADGAIVGDYVTMALAGLIPAALADDPSRAFVIGWGTGVTAGELAALDSVRDVTVAEISPAVLRAAPFFDFGNLAASRSPEVRTLRSDAYRALLRQPGRFGVIVSEPSNPWVTGVEMLFSREFLAAARERLAPGGVFAQWFHAYETDAETAGLVLRTYADVFDHVAVWYATGTDLLLLGFESAPPDLGLERLAERTRRPDFRAGLARCQIDSLPALLAHELLPLGVVHAASLEGEIHTLLHPRLSYAAARAFFVGAMGRLPRTDGLEPAEVGARNSLARRYAARSGGGLANPDRATMAAEACKYRGDVCIALLAGWRAAAADSPLRSELERKLSARPQLAEHLQRLPDVGRLYGDGIVDGGDPLASAQLATGLFEAYYHHAAPFPRAGLAATYARCEAEPASREACHAARLELERQIGSLAAPGPADASRPTGG